MSFFFFFFLLFFLGFNFHFIYKQLYLLLPFYCRFCLVGYSDSVGCFQIGWKKIHLVSVFSLKKKIFEVLCFPLFLFIVFLLVEAAKGVEK